MMRSKNHHAMVAKLAMSMLSDATRVRVERVLGGTTAADFYPSWQPARFLYPAIPIRCIKDLPASFLYFYVSGAI